MPEESGRQGTETRGIAAEKAALRKAMRARRDSIPAEQRAPWSADIARRLAETPEFVRARSPLCYLAFRSEVETAPVVECALTLGKRVCVPVVGDDRILVPCRYTCPADLVPSRMGMLEPRPECLEPLDPKEIDLVIVPGTAFDISGGRLGYGLGYFDRLFPRLGEMTPRIALAFELQIVSRVPVEPHDCPVDYIVTETRVIRTGARKLN
jgi:5-formyltetrahydrofolate cyclo-ligase